MKILILDRDGVINEDREDFVKSAKEWVPIAGSISAMAKLTQAGYHLVIATNQSGLGRGKFTLLQLNAMHSKMCRLVSEAGGHIDAIFYCPHTPHVNCSCRKPKAGMLIAIAKRYRISPAALTLIGDAARDLEAIAAIDGQPILVLTGKGKNTKQRYSLPKNTLIFDHLSMAADYLIEQARQEGYNAE